jgi:hypothetical protein
MTRMVGILLMATTAAACGARTTLELPTLEGGGGVAGQAGTPSAQAGMPAGGASHTLPDNCAAEGVTFIYLVTADRVVFAFDPEHGFTFANRGTLPCAPGGAQSMAVDRTGHAYVESNDFQLFSVSLANLGGCRATPFANSGLGRFGMAFSSDTADSGETLFLTGQAYTDANELVSVNLGDFQVTERGVFSNIGDAELTGTGDGRLYAFGVDGPGGASHLAQVDKQTAAILSDMTLPFQENAAWAFAWWGGAFYFFTSGGGPSIVRRLDPNTGAVATVANAPGVVVGAGVSTCAPLD